MQHTTKAVPRAQKAISLGNIESVLLGNECIVCKQYCIFEYKGRSEKGVICVTNLQILLITNRKKPAQRISLTLSTEACILEKIHLGIIETLYKSDSKEENPCLYLSCKDGRIFSFLVAATEEMDRLYHHIYAFAFPGEISRLFAFYNRPTKSNRKIVDFFPDEEESDEESDEDPFKLPRSPFKQESSEDLSSTIADETETDTDIDFVDDDTGDIDFMMFDGWDVFHPKREYLRLGVRVSGREKRRKLPRILREQLYRGTNLTTSPLYKSQWRLSKKNLNYTFCETYPRYFAVPRWISDEELKGMDSFRKENRIPTLSFLHSETYASICRSSQLVVGFHGPRNHFDELLVHAIQQSGLNKNAPLFFMDVRTCKAQRTGAGAENLKYYPNCEYEYLRIPCVKKLRKYHSELFELMRECKGSVLACDRVEQQTVAIIDALRDERALRWSSTIQIIIQSSFYIVQLCHQGNSTIVHSPTGRDRPQLVISLAMLQLDPFYRTIEGFEVLIEKEWSSAGFQYQTRTGHGTVNAPTSSRAPTFIIFLECVWQILQQQPDSFEFNEEFILFLTVSLYNCRFGTFLYDSEKERKETNLYEKTCSVWSYTNCNPTFLNPRFKQVMTERSISYSKTDILPIDPTRTEFWLGYYFFDLPESVVISIQHWQVGKDLSKKGKYLNEEQLKKRVAELEKEQVELKGDMEAMAKQNRLISSQNEKLSAKVLDLQHKLALHAEVEDNSNSLCDEPSPS